MRKLSLATTAALLLLAAFGNSFAQQSQPQLFTDIERVLREKEPRWKTERVSVGTETDPLRLDIVLRAGQQQAAIAINLWTTEKDAHDVFAAHAAAMSNTRKGSRRSRLPNLGVENYIWTNPGGAAWPIIHFRQSRAHVTVFAPSITVAERFARHVLSQVTANQD
ncbi:MAG TPA: hypothetical protein VGB61_14460 [Pyrinomonadaceae bacterium]|jgi:hypothetical protein